MKITILDPAICCSTGVCGENVDDVLIQTAANVKWLKELGHDVNRHNISNDGAAFKDYPVAIEKLQKEGMDSLPYILIDDVIVTTGNYPKKEEWMQLLDFENTAFQYSATFQQTGTTIEILISIGAAIAASNEKALKKSIDLAKAANISIEKVAMAMNIGNDCKVKLSQEVVQIANSLMNEMHPAASSCCSGTGCC